MDHLSINANINYYYVCIYIAEQLFRNYCVPYIHVHYVKIPKTGSSTMSNILHRIVTKFNLKLLTNFKTCSIFMTDYADRIERFDMATQHYVFNETNILKCLHLDTKFITVIRHPHALLKSHMLYKNVVISDRNSSITEIPKEQTKVQELFNSSRMTSFMGIDTELAASNDTYFRKQLKYLDNRFDLVMINEHYDESLVLLKRLMCWSLKDVLYFELKKQQYPESDYFDSDEIKQKHQEEVKIEYTLYSYFLNIFNRKISMEINLNDEVHLYKEIKAKVNGFCDKIVCNLLSVDTLLQMSKSIFQYLEIESSNFNEQFNVSGSDCLLMSFKLRCYRPMLLAQLHTRLSIPLGDNNDYAQRNKNNFLTENIPYDLVHSCNEASFSCFQFLATGKKIKLK